MKKHLPIHVIWSLNLLAVYSVVTTLVSIKHIESEGYIYLTSMYCLNKPIIV